MTSVNNTNTLNNTSAAATHHNVADETNPALDLNEQLLQRRTKLKELRSKGDGIAFPNDFKRSHLALDIINEYQHKSTDELQAAATEVVIAGRIMAKRLMGKASFIHVRDQSSKIQVYVKASELVAVDATNAVTTSSASYDEFKHWDLGDIVGITGVVFKTQTGELSIKAHSIRLLTKALRPLPDKWHGLSDVETRYRQRYVDLIVNPEARAVFVTRIKIIQALRDFLIARGYLEVETPMMQPIPGGAAAKPFVTHHNALDMDLYLRISPELYLKRLIVGGFEKVFEINRNFRNEGLSTKHNPEFTMVEFYQAYADYQDLIILTEELFKFIAHTVLNKYTLEYMGETLDFGKPFAKFTIREAILHYNPDLTAADLSTKESLVKIIKAKGGHVKAPNDTGIGIGTLQLELFELTVEDKLIQPTFITEFPTEVSPLARSNDKNPEVTDRFELFIGGREVANAFSELNDAEDQAERFAKQVANKNAGDEEAMHYDADYIRALEYGMPPTAGEGIGIDRLVMLFTNSNSIRDVLLFPHMRPD
jgi:lysyl-tRNA synthetase class 2